MSDAKSLIIQQLYEENVDFRSLNNLKNNLFNSEKLNGKLIPIEEYQSIKKLIMKEK